MKKVVNALGIITIIVIVAICGVVVGSAFTGVCSVEVFFKELGLSWISSLAKISDLFKAESFKNFMNHWGSYASYLALVLLFVFFVLTIIFCCVKHHGKRSCWVIAYVFAAAPAILLYADEGYAQLGGMRGIVTSFINDANVGNKILGWCMIIIPAVLVLFMILHFIFLMISLKEKKAEEAVPEEVVANEVIPEEKAEELPEELEALPEPEAQSFEVEPEPEPIPTYVEAENEPEEEPAPEQPKVEEPQPQVAPAANPLDINALAASIREVVRDIVKDELARQEANKPEEKQGNTTSTVTGATFGGPLVVQYFNGGIQGVAPVAQPVVAQPVVAQPAPAPVQPAEPAPVQPAPVKEEPKPVVKQPVAPAPVPAPKKEEPAPVVPEVAEEKKVYERIPFQARMIEADKEMQAHYNELKNEILSYGVKSRVSNSGDAFRLHTKTYVKIAIAGKSLKLYLALDPKDYKDSTLPISDASGKGIYEEIPLVFKVKSDLSMRRAKQLIQEAMEKDGLTQGEVEKTNWVKELKASAK